MPPRVDTTSIADVAARHCPPLPALPCAQLRDAPGEPRSWLFAPPLHAGVGALTEAATHVWQCHPQVGVRFSELAALAGALWRAPAAQPSTILRFPHAELGVDVPARSLAGPLRSSHKLTPRQPSCDADAT